ncbi:MAG: pyruvate:ferredoxin (flavodoxin) oxidoreductase, partial [Sphaerochaetaceae bacterium]|nr:pyruvate:ferredoxin (flavodoxin) oxidoreductase [Sphaerochaetaceae bacterium]
MFWGLGSDGTVGANKDSIKIIGGNTDMNAQAYFSYDSKKSGGITISHLRFGKSSVNMPWLIDSADFVACHNPAYLGRYDMLAPLKEGGVFLLNSVVPAEKVFTTLTASEQQTIIEKKIRFYTIDAYKIAEKVGLGTRINTVMQAVFFKISGIFPEQEAMELIKNAIKKTFSKKGEDIVKMNWDAVDSAAAALEEVKIPASAGESFVPKQLISDDASDFAKDIIEPVMRLKGNDIPVSKMSFDGTLPTNTAKLEKRGVAPSIPHWISENCIQCNQCVQSCPHAAIRAKQIDPKDLENAPETFNTLKSNTKNDRELLFKIQVYTEDCQGCGVCIETCPSKVKSLEFSPIQTERDRGEYDNAVFFDALPDNVLDGVSENTLKGMQFKKPLFEFSGACAGCGETPYVKLVSQICGERMLAANATGCSSIYGGTFPTTPYAQREDGRGPAWGNSLFEDNAEYGMGMRLAVDSNRRLLWNAVQAVLEAGASDALTEALKKNIELWNDKTEASIDAQKSTQAILAETTIDTDALRKIVELKDYFTEKDVWIIGGDGWAYDIGYGGLDHVVASGKNVNILVLDTEVYSNTGGQASKATPIGAVAKFANAGMQVGKKNMGIMMMSYGHAYVASVSMGANRLHTQKALQEAVAFDGPSIVFCYAPCINHGINMMKSQVEEKRAVDVGYWPLYRYNPGMEEGKRFSWDAKAQDGDYQEFIKGERRYTALYKTNPDNAEDLFARAEADAKNRMALYKNVGALM